MTRAKILVVDDERHIVKFIRRTLERQGYRAVVGFDGREALEKAAAEQPDLIVLDLMMPYMDALKRRRPSVPTRSHQQYPS